MKNFDNEIKKSIEEIKPDPYMETRLSAKVSDYKKPKVSPLIKRISAAAIALAIVCTGIGANYAVKNNRSDLDFTIVAYAQDGKSKHTLSDDEIIFTDLQFIYRKNEVKEGDSPINYMETKNTLDFGIDAENITEVTFESENYGFDIYDDNMRDNQFERDDYYIVKIPLNDEEIKKFSAIQEFDIEDRTQKKFLKEMMKNRDLSEYFGDNSMNVDDYYVHEVLDNTSDKIKEFGLENIGYITPYFYLVKKDVYEDITRGGKSVTVKNYNDEDRIHGIMFDTWTAVWLIKDNPDMKLSDLPKDKITVTVKFTSGETVTKHILTEFDDNGYLHCSLEQ